MAKQLNVNLAFTADTSQAQANIKMLQQDLAKIANTTTPANMPLNDQMKQAVASAKELQRHLSNAMDAKTGNINLNALNASLKSSNASLGNLTAGLLNAGASGEKAFMSVQRAITSSNVQINQANGALSNFLTTLKNTARWQISSSVLHGFMGTIQSAWHYAQNLDKSLNNIRIVTGASADEMARFADQANKTAKALSTTTTNYTNASLIYYQQGLSDSEVKERTDVTIKMANAAGESAETVSTQMTAVWNNFDDGSKSLEYYADVMTALGAATASSTAEISEGLQKFASVAETVGLSYEYATSALATITATTRESASVVGTALKTLFARIQGLQLGETLEDGVDLNKYSAALDKIGVSIFEANGEMKTMDNILEETAAKWDTMAKSEQMALAQTVAGVRQYTQFMALMENWDFMEQNLDVAYGAEGTLDVQADIYAESWEAASKRARAAMESLYNDLIPTDFIVGLTDGFGDFITMIDAVVDGMGGLPTILMLVSSIILNKMGPSLAQTFDNGIQKVTQFNTKLQEAGHSNFIGGALSTGFNKLTHTIQNSNQAASDLSSKLNEINSAKVGEQTGLFSDNASKTTLMSQNMVKTAIAAQGVSDAFKQYQGHTAQILNYQNLIEQSTKYMTAAERESLSVAQQELAAINEKMYAENQITQSLQAQAEARANNVDTEMLVNTYSTQGGVGYDSKMSQSMLSHAQMIAKEWDNLGIKITEVNGKIQTTANSEEALSAGYTKAVKQLDSLYQLNRQIRDIQNDTKNTDITQRSAAIKKLINDEIERKNIAKEVLDMYSNKNGIKSGNELETAMRSAETAATGFGRAVGVSSTTMQQVNAGANATVDSMYRGQAAATQWNNAVGQLNSKFSDITQRMSGMGTMLTTGLQGFTTVAMGINAVSNAVKTLNDDTASFGSKLTSLAMAGTMGISALTTAFSGFKTVMTAVKTVTSTYNTIQKVSTVLTQARTAATNMDSAVQLKHNLHSVLGNNIELKGNIIRELRNTTDIKGVLIKYNLISAENLHRASMIATLAVMAAVVLAVVGLVKAYDALNLSSEESLENATAAAQRLKEQAQEAKQEAEGIKDAFNNYQSVVDTLYQCTRGTEEWTNALNDVKNTVSEILEKYPELMSMAGLLQFDENTGTYLLNEGMMNDYITQAENKADTLEYASFMGTARQLEAQGQIELERFNEAAINGSLSNIIQMSDLTDNEAQNQAIINDILTNKYGEDWAETYGRYAEEMAAAAANYHQAMNEAGQTVLNASRLTATELLSDENGMTNYASEAIDAAAAVGADLYDEVYDDVAEQLRKQYNKGDNAGDIGTHGVDDVLAEYAEITGVEWDTNAIRGTDDGHRRYVIKDGQGGTTDLYEEDIVSVVAAARAAEQSTALMQQSADYVQSILVGAGDELANFISALTNGTAGLNQGLRDFLSGFTEEDIGSMINDTEYTVDEVTGRVSGIDEDLLNYLGVDELGFNQLAESFGITGQELIVALNNLANEMAGESNGGTGEGGIDVGTERYLKIHGMDASQMSIDEANKFEAAALAATDAVGTSLSQISQENAGNKNLTEYYNALAQVDRTAAGAGEQIAALNEEYGIQGPAAEALVESYTETGTKLAVATGNIIDNQKALQEIVGEEGLSYGSILDEAAITSLQEMGINTDQYFQRMADGTYVLTTAAEEFNSVINGITIDNMEEQLNMYRQAEMQALYGKYNQEYLGDKVFSEEAGGMLTAKARADYASSFSDESLLNMGLSSEDLTLIKGIQSGEVIVGEEEVQRMYEITQMIQQSKSALEESLMALQLDQYGVDSEQFYAARDAYQEMAESGNEAYAYMVNDSEALNDAAMRYTRLNNAVMDLSDNYEDYSEILSEVLNTSDELDKAMLLSSDAGINLRKSLANLLNISEELVDVELIESIAPSDLKGAAEGNIESINNLRETYIDYLATMHELEGAEEFKNYIGGLEEGATIDINTDPFLKALIQAELAAGSSMTAIEGKLSGLTIDCEIVGLYDTLAEAEAAAAATGGQIIDDLTISQTIDPGVAETNYEDQEITYNTEYSPEVVESENQVMKNGADELESMTESRTNWSKTVNSSVESTPAKKSTAGFSSSAKTASGQSSKGYMVINSPHKSSSSVGSSSKPRSSGGGGGGGGGGSSKPAKKIRKTKKQDIVERYKELNDQLDENKERIDDLNNAMEGLYGKARIDKIREYREALRKEIDLIQEKIKLNRQYLKEDKEALQAAAAEAGLSLQFDSEGNITNYTEQLSILHAKLNELEEQQNALGTEEAQNEFAEENIEPLQEQIDLLTEAIETYEETLQEYEDFINEMEDRLREIAESQFEELSYSIEVKLDLKEDSLAVLEYYFDKLSDSLYDSAEAFGYLLQQMETYSKFVTEIDEDNIALLAEKAKKEAYNYTYQEALDAGFTEEEAKEMAESVGQQAYIDFMREQRDIIIDNAEAVNDLIEQFDNFYSEVLENANEELQEHIDKYDHLNALIEHHLTLMELENGETNYGGINTILAEQNLIIDEQLKAERERYNFYKNEKERLAKILEDTPEDDPMYQFYKNSYDTAEQLANESMEAISELAINKLENAKEIMLNEVKQYQKELTATLAGYFGNYGSLEEVNQAMERRNTLQEEYLTNTNKIYETEKLMRTAQKAIDETTNTVAKRRLKQFIEETEQLQKQGELSQFELDIQQAKYDLLLAEIALEEAQNAKSTVRLQRDAEGNFGYVYTADQDQISEAQQQLEDAENKLYNIRLEGANDYSEKYVEAMNSMYEELAEIEELRLEDEEEYNRRRSAIMEHYTNLLNQYSELYTIATEEDSRIRVDAWSTEFDILNVHGENWSQNFTDYIGKVDSSFDKWKETIDDVKQLLDNIIPGYDTLSTSAENLTLTIKEDIIPALEAEKEGIMKLKDEYTKFRLELQKSLELLENNLETIDNALGAATGRNTSNEDSETEADNSSSTTPPPTNDKSKTADEKTKIGVAAAVWYGLWSQDTRRSKLLDEKGFNAGEIQSLVNKGEQYIYNKAKEFGIDLNDLSKYGPSAFDTGGYTGNWGAYGKLGILHEKELVLNANDTANFLASMDILEDIIKMIDVQAYQAQLANLSLPTFRNMTDTLEQNVYIEANFPEAKDRFEIEEAFNNLINKASQYANRK